MKIAGILGGLGPQSTALFYEEIIRIGQRQAAVVYPRLLINSMSIWEFEQKMSDPVALLQLLAAEMGRLESQVDFWAMVCNTAHSVLEPLRTQISVPVIGIQEEVVRKIREDGLQKVGILGTKLTTGSRFYQKELDRFAIDSVCLPAQEAETFNQLIFKEMLRGESYQLMHLRLKAYAHWLRDQGCEGVILGCTEFPLFLSQADVEIRLYASTQILAESVFLKCIAPEAFRDA